MKKVFQKIERIRAKGTAILDLPRSSPYFKFNGVAHSVIAMGPPGVKCKITLQIDGRHIDFTLDQVL